MIFSVIGCIIVLLLIFNYDMTHLENLIKAGSNIKIEISPEDLDSFGKTIAERLIDAVKSQTDNAQASTYYSAEKVMKILDISRTTLWQWDKKGLTKPIRLGNLKRYKKDDIESIGQSKV